MSRQQRHSTLLSIHSSNSTEDPGQTSGTDTEQNTVRTGHTTGTKTTTNSDLRKLLEIPALEVKVAIGVHYGQGHIFPDPSGTSFDYAGPVVNGAASVADVAQGHQVPKGSFWSPFFVFV